MVSRAEASSELSMAGGLILEFAAVGVEEVAPIEMSNVVFDVETGHGAEAMVPPKSLVAEACMRAVQQDWVLVARRENPEARNKASNEARAYSACMWEFWLSCRLYLGLCFFSILIFCIH